MWNPEDRYKVHLAGLDADTNRLTSYIPASMRAGVFGGKMYIEFIPQAQAKIEMSGVMTQAGIYDHCGHFCRTITLNEPLEVKKGRWNDVTFEVFTITITSVS